MRKNISVFVMILMTSVVFAQQSANRFFYELTFKPKKAEEKREKIMTALDITTEKSIYEDFTIRAQDSIIKQEVEQMTKTGVFKDLMKTITMPKFTYKVVKKYPSMEVSVQDNISNKRFSYQSPTKLNWNVDSEKTKIGVYAVQKATTDFGGRQWTAWFTMDIPFQDGPYKFHGLPGLIVKIEDSKKEYSWELKGNENIAKWEELSYTQKMQSRFGMSTTVVEITKEKFDKAYANFKADPLGEFRMYMTPEVMKQPLPGTDKTVGDMIKDQEKMAKDFFAAVDNPIEIE